MEDFIDVHTHVFDERTHDEYCRKTGERRGQLITIQYWTGNAKPKYSLDGLLSFVGTKDDLSLMPAINPNFPVDLQVVDLWNQARNIVGVKIYPGYEHHYPADPMFEPVVKFCIDYDKPLMLHSGDTSARGMPLLKYAHPLHIDELAVRHPELKIVIAHLGFPWLLEAAAVVHKNKNVYADLSGIIDKQEPRALARLTRRYADDLSRVLDYYPDIAHKLMFGTDFGGEHTHLCEVEPYFEVVDRVFGSSARQCVYRTTAQKIFFPDG